MQQLVRLVGIAKQAAEGSLLIEKRRVEYRSLPTRSWLNRCRSSRVPFQWTINPYRGCEYGCKYCYARFTHEFLEKQELDSFETEIYAKEWNAAQFQSELRQVKAGHAIGLGTATDPYQPAERKFGRTRTVLEALRTISGISLFVTTKSDLAARDAELYRAISKKNEVHVTFSVTTTDAALSRQTEPFAPRPELRLQAVRTLVESGVSAGVIASPILPWITDSEENLESVARAAREAGANQFGANLLFLMPSSKRVYQPFIEQQFPALAAQYRESYQKNAYMKGSYPQMIAERVNRIRERVGIAKRDLARTAPPKDVGAQMLLF